MQIRGDDGFNVIKLSKINNIGFYLATGKALFFDEIFFQL